MLLAIEAAAEVVDCSARKWRTTITTTTCTTTASRRTDAAQCRYIDRQQHAEGERILEALNTETPRTLAPPVRASVWGASYML